MDSIIFVTLSDGCYKDRWTTEPVPLLQTDEYAGYRELTWEGQSSGLRDKHVKQGTLVAVRPNKKVRYFEIIGTVADIACVRPWSKDAPAEYKLLVKLYAVARRIYKLKDDRFTHNNILRELGFPLETGAMPHGIYAK